MTKKQSAHNLFLILLGTMLFGLSYSIFLEPHTITGGGLSGVALIIYFMTGFPPGVATFLLNIPLFVIAFRSVGKRFFTYSIVGMTMYTVFIELIMAFQAPILDFIGYPDIMLSAIYAGVLGGIGTGLVVRSGGSTGGSDLIAGLVNRKNPNISVGRVMMMFDLTVVVVNSIVGQSFMLALYSIIAIGITTVVIDFFIDGFKECRAYYIISEKYEDIAEVILKKLNRGATNFSGRGMYTKKEKNMLLVLVRKREQAELRNIIKRVDPLAFIFAISAKEVLGEGFNPLETKEKAQPRKKEGEK